MDKAQAHKALITKRNGLHAQAYRIRRRKDPISAPFQNLIAKLGHWFRRSPATDEEIHRLEAEVNLLEGLVRRDRMRND